MKSDFNLWILKGFVFYSIGDHGIALKGSLKFCLICARDCGRQLFKELVISRAHMHISTLLYRGRNNLVDIIGASERPTTLAGFLSFDKTLKLVWLNALISGNTGSNWNIMFILDSPFFEED